MGAIIDSAGRKGTRINREKLLEILKKNRETHRTTFEKAQVGYRAAVIEELEKSLADARSNKRIRRIIELIEPLDETKSYDKIIRMLELSVDDVITLDERDFGRYVMDEWEWSDQFSTSNAAYTGQHR